jgi:integrase
MIMIIDSWATVAELPAAEQADAIATLWAFTGSYAESAADRLGTIIGQYGTWLSNQGVASLVDATNADCLGFITAATRRGNPPSASTMQLRRTALRGLYGTVADLGGPELTITDRLGLPARRPLDNCAVSDADLAIIRIAALVHPARLLHAPSLIALAEATATTGEIALIRWSQLDLDTGQVALPGAGRTQPRIGSLTQWGTRILRARDSQNPGGLVAAVAATTLEISQAAVVMTVGRLLRDTLLDPLPKPGSLRLWAPAAFVHDGGSIEDASRMLGIASLDVTARLLQVSQR